MRVTKEEAKQRTATKIGFDPTRIWLRDKVLEGGLHADVDCLPRAPVNNQDDNYLEERVMAVLSPGSRYSPVEQSNVAVIVPLNDSVWKQEQEEDEEAEEHWRKARTMEKMYKIFNGLLYFERRLYVPSRRR